jgi:preprotein translocase subunit SecG
MGLIAIVLLIIMVISALLLVLVILVQDEEGEGIGGLFGGGSSTPFGSRSGNVLTRFTAVLAVIFLFCAFSVAWFNRTPEAENLIGKARQQTLQQGENNDWWQPTSPTGTQTPNAAQPQTSPPDTAAPASPSAPTPGGK